MTDFDPGGPEEPCSRRCGYVSNGADLLRHEREDHSRCPECGNWPYGFYPVTHKSDCSRIAPTRPVLTVVPDLEAGQ